MRSFFVFILSAVLFIACSSQKKHPPLKEVSFDEYLNFLDQPPEAIEYLLENTRFKFLSEGAEPDYFANYKWSNPDSMIDYVIFSRGLANSITKIQYSISKQDYAINLPEKFKKQNFMVGEVDRQSEYVRSDYVYEKNKSKRLYVFISLSEKIMGSNSYYSAILTSIVLPEKRPK